MAEVFQGLFTYIEDLLQKRLSDYHGPAWVEKCQKSYKNVLLRILDYVDYPERCRPLTLKELSNPNSKAVCIIMYVYSMETPFTHEFANKKHDDKNIHSLGPFDRCLQEIVNSEKCEMNRVDCLEPSSKMTDPRAFLVYKATMMNKEKIDKWREMAGKKVRFPSITTFHENFREAMYFVNHYERIKKEMGDLGKTMKVVVFVLCLFN